MPRTVVWTFLGVLIVAVAASAQGPDLMISPLWEAPSMLPVRPNNPMEADKINSEIAQNDLSGSEIWRLPPVAPKVDPTALVLPPLETIPPPAPQPQEFAPIANAPVALPNDGVVPVTPAEPVRGPWDGSFDLGLAGSEGNSETFNFRFGCHANRKCENNILTLGIDYNKSTAETVPTSNRAFFEGRFEWLIHDSRWSWFFHETVEYDEFQSYNVRDAFDAGLGYRLIRNDTTTVIGRFGSGFSHEFGGPEDGMFTPEGVFGLQFEHHISKRQKLMGMVEYAPDIGDFYRYRIRSQAAWEVLLDTEKNLSLRVGVLDRYTSQSNGARHNDLDYASVLIWRF